MKMDKGFTFVETLIVLAIILILSASIGISGSKYIDQSRESSAITEIAMYTNALNSYYFDCGIFPSEMQGLGALWAKPEYHPVPENWHGPYVNKEPSTDPWGREYIYKDVNESGLPFSIICTGPDGQEFGGTTDDNIYSWK